MTEIWTEGGVCVGMISGLYLHTNYVAESQKLKQAFNFKVNYR